MAALTPVQHVAVHLFVVWIQFAQAPEDPVLAKPGQNVTLQCHTYTDAAIKLLKWSRPELKLYVFFHIDNKSMETYQDPRYQGRVELKDPLMKNGDASVLLKNVDISDTGKYHCLVITDSSNQSVGEFVRSVHLSVSEQVKAKAGEDVTLLCNTSTDAAITKLEWRRTGLKDDYVLYFRDNRANESFQDPRYRGRVELKDPEMKSGDASVLLKNVSIKDRGTYQCLVLTSPQNSSKRDAGEPLVASIQLSVYTFGSDKKQPEGLVGRLGLGLVLGVGLVVVLVAFIGLGVFLHTRKRRVKKEGSEECVDEQEMCEMNTELFTPDCPPSPASKPNNHESLTCCGGRVIPNVI